MGNESSNVPSPAKKNAGKLGKFAGLLFFIKGNAVINYQVVSTIVFVHPEPWESPILRNIFQMGWFNHQPVLFIFKDTPFFDV